MVNTIIRGLYIGDMTEVAHAERDEMEVLSVMWGEEDGSPEGVKNIQTTRFIETDDGYKTVADCDKMNEAADWIREHIRRNRRVMVHCSFGMQRSPITIVWYLMRHLGYSLDEAYRIVKVNRPMAQDCRSWFPMNWETKIQDGLDKEAA